MRSPHRLRRAGSSARPTRPAIQSRHAQTPPALLKLNSPYTSWPFSRPPETEVAGSDQEEAPLLVREQDRLRVEGPPELVEAADQVSAVQARGPATGRARPCAPTCRRGRWASASTVTLSGGSPSRRTQKGLEECRLERVGGGPAGAPAGGAEGVRDPHANTSSTRARPSGGAPRACPPRPQRYRPRSSRMLAIDAERRSAGRPSRSRVVVEAKAARLPAPAEGEVRAAWSRRCSRARAARGARTATHKPSRGGRPSTISSARSRAQRQARLPVTIDRYAHAHPLGACLVGIRQAGDDGEDEQGPRPPDRRQPPAG